VYAFKRNSRNLHEVLRRALKNTARNKAIFVGKVLRIVNAAEQARGKQKLNL